MGKLEAVRKVNPNYTILDVTHPEFKAYGTILEGYDDAAIKEYAEKKLSFLKKGIVILHLMMS